MFERSGGMRKRKRQLRAIRQAIINRRTVSASKYLNSAGYKRDLKLYDPIFGYAIPRELLPIELPKSLFRS